MSVQAEGGDTWDISQQQGGTWNQEDLVCAKGQKCSTEAM